MREGEGNRRCSMGDLERDATAFAYICEGSGQCRLFEISGVSMRLLVVIC
jgi:hypothetical protein